MKAFGLMLYGLAVLPIMFAVLSGWYAAVWGFNPAAIFPVYAVLLAVSLALWFTGRVLRSR